ncbi:uncharacterized protein V6R79_005749 [Siganus canaliculatus]
MTIGRNSRKSSTRSSIRAPKFLDKSSGFYGRLDEPEVPAEGEEVWGNEMEDGNRDGVNEREELEAFDFMEDDGETLLERKPSRLSSRWRRSSRRKQKEAKVEEDAANPNQEVESPAEPAAMMIEIEIERMKKVEEENEKAGQGKESSLVHFSVRSDEDDQVLIRDQKTERGEEGEEGEEERRMKMDQEEGMKVVKKNAAKNYRKTLNQAFRRGWKAFIANLYSVTLTPVTSSSPSPSSKKKMQHSAVLAEFR